MSKEDEGMMGETIDALWCEFRFVCEGVNYLKHWHVTKLAIIHSWPAGHSKLSHHCGKSQKWGANAACHYRICSTYFLIKKIMTRIV